LKNLPPGYRTIANFRKENWKALKAANRNFVLLIRELGLIGGTVVAIDGSFFHGDAIRHDEYRFAPPILRVHDVAADQAAAILFRSAHPGATFPRTLACAFP
jgi:hypothetical protein